MPAAALEAIPSEVVNLKEIHERRIMRRKEALDEITQRLTRELEPFSAAQRKAVHAYEDHFDDSLVKYKRDPNAMSFDERDPAEVKQARALKRGVEDADAALRRKQAELNEQLRATPEFAAFKAAQEEHDDWLAKVCVHLCCCTGDFNWKERKITRNGAVSNIPPELTKLPIA